MTLSDLLDAIRANWPTKVLSLVVAVVLWFYVLESKDPQTTQAIEVPVQVINKPEDLEVISITPETVELRLRGRQSAFRNDDAGRIVMQADLRGAKVGENQVPLRIARLPYKLMALPGYPTTATVDLDKIIRRERPVQYVRRGEPADGFIVDRVTLEPDTVTVIGATSIVSRVARVVVVVDLSGLNTSIEFQAEVEARDHRDVVVSGVRFEPARVKVAVSLQQVDVKTVPVRPLLGDPPSGWRVATVSTDPPVVTVTGEGDLKQVTSVSTSRLDISGLRGTKTYVAPLNVPRGLTVLGPASVEVTVTTQRPDSTASSRPREPEPETRDTGVTGRGEDKEGSGGNNTITATGDEEGTGEGSDTAGGGGTQPSAPHEERPATTPEPIRPGR